MGQVPVLFKRHNKVWYKFVILICVLLPLPILGQVEICDNGIDDDFDNLIDLNDEDCTCEIIEPESLIPNPSFEERDCCPSSRSQLNCATSWIQASAPTTDFINICGWLGWDDFPPPQPFPDGDGIMGFRDGRVRNNGLEPNWKEYAGACLISPLLTNTSYRFQFDVGFVSFQQSPPIDISFFGTSSCEYLPFGGGDQEFGCPSNSPDWKKLGEVRVSGGVGNTWVNTFIEIVPEEDIYAIAIGPDCAPVNSQVSTYYFFDNLILDDLETFELRIEEVEHPCSSDFTLSIAYDPDYEYQWYLEGVALEGEVSSELTKNYGEGIYQVRILDGESCRISTSYEYRIPVYNTPLAVTICEGEAYPFGGLPITAPGVYVDTFTTQYNCDSIVALELAVIATEYDTLEASILEGERYEIATQGFRQAGDYLVTLTSSTGCDSLVLLQLTTFEVFIPNAFSPNYDGINDKFLPFAPAGKVKSVDIQIYDRWGNLLHQGSEWNGGDLQPGVYVYAINISFSDGTSNLFSGEVTLLR